MRTALAEIGAVDVDLDGVPVTSCPTTSTPQVPVEPWAALLPPLDPTTMGWYERDWYLGDYKAQLFDTAGNAGPTVWWDGRIVGGWRQDARRRGRAPAARGRRPRRPRALEAEAARLTEWLGGGRVVPRFPSPLSKQLAATER